MRRTHLALAALLLISATARAQTPAQVYVVKDRAGNVASAHASAAGAHGAIQAYETSPRRRDAGPWRVAAVPLREDKRYSEL